MQICTPLILKYKFYKHFPISSDYLHKKGLFSPKCLILDLLSLEPLLISFIRYGLPLCLFVHHLILEYKFYKHFPISSDFCIKMDYFALKCLILDILSLAPFLISFIRLWTTLVQICTPLDP